MFGPIGERFTNSRTNRYERNHTESTSPTGNSHASFPNEHRTRCSERASRPFRYSVQASVLTIYTPPGGGSLHTSGHEMNLRANRVQKRAVLNATPANEIGMPGELRIGDWRWPEPLPPASSHRLGALLSKPAYAFRRTMAWRTRLHFRPAHRLTLSAHPESPPPRPSR